MIVDEIIVDNSNERRPRIVKRPSKRRTQSIESDNTDSASDLEMPPTDYSLFGLSPGIETAGEILEKVVVLGMRNR